MVSIHQVPEKPIVNQTNKMSGPSTAAHISGKSHLDDGASDILYKFTTPDIAAKGKFDPDRDNDIESSGTGRHDNLPQQVLQPSRVDRQSSTVPAAQPRLVTAPAGKNNLDSSSAQDSEVKTSEVKFWCPWEAVSRTIHPAVPRASFKQYIPQPLPQPTPAGTLYNLSTMAPMTTPYMIAANRTGYMPRLRDLLLTTVEPVMRSEIPPPTSFLPQTSGAPKSHFIAFTPRPYIVRKSGSRIQMTKVRGPQTNLERPQPRQ